jgi:hypothetical protein
VFINVVLSTVDMLKLGKAGKVVGYIIGLYMLTTVMAALIGIASVLMFKGLFIKSQLPETGPSFFNFECGSGKSAYVTELESGQLACVNATTSSVVAEDPR